MKNLLYTTCLLICFNFVSLTVDASVSGRGKSDSLSCLQIEGKIINTDETPGECFIEVIGTNNEIDSISLKEGKTKFKYVLKKDSYYTIRISKAGYLSKLICVNTEILTEPKGLYRFEFETALMKEVVVKNLNKDVLDFPVAIIYFDYEKDCFSHNKEYSASIKRELHTRKHTKKHGSHRKDADHADSATFASVSK